MDASAGTAKPSKAKERLLSVASDLFYREGIHGVGLDRVFAEAHVTRATLYRHFTGKEELVASYLEREDQTLRGYFAQADEQTSDPHELVDVIIATIALDIERYHTRGCPFINAAAEYPDADSDVRRIVSGHREWFRSALVDVLRGAEVPHPDEAAESLMLLRDAALVGGYLDGVERVAPAFIRTARQVVAA